jgi:hypothetical protein
MIKPRKVQVNLGNIASELVLLSSSLGKPQGFYQKHTINLSRGNFRYEYYVVM